MKNWIGQTIDVGSWVYRGAREGNTSSYKIGRVVSVNEEKGRARVNWKFEPASWNYLFERAGMDKSSYEHLTVDGIDTFGSPSIDSLVVIDIDEAELTYLAATRAALTQAARDLTANRRV